MRQESPQLTMLGAGVCPSTRVCTHGPTRRRTPWQGCCSGPSSSATHEHHAGRSPGTGSRPPNHQGNGGSSITGPGLRLSALPEGQFSGNR